MYELNYNLPAQVNFKNFLLSLTMEFSTINTRWEILAKIEAQSENYVLSTQWINNFSDLIANFRLTPSPDNQQQARLRQLTPVEK